jgi:hypothetical protein
VEAENTAIEHQNVPEGHQGLHGFLYGSEDEHTAAVTTTPSLENSSELMPLKTGAS